MDTDPHALIRVAVADDGTVTYLVDLPPESLPPVRLRDVAAAWETARTAARSAIWGRARLFRFRRADGGLTDLALADADACCWAGAIDQAAGMHTSYGLSLCLRLLALVDLLARERWAAPLVTLTRAGARLNPALLRAAALAPLNGEARFDETPFRALVAARLDGPGAAPLASGARAMTPPPPIRRSIVRVVPPLLAMLATAGLAGCAPTSSSSSANREAASPKAMAACRNRADDVFNQQNRADVYRSDMYAGGQRDAPFGAGLPGNPGDGLSARYARETMLDDCLNGTSGGTDTPSPTAAAPASPPGP